jgi:iron complex transport system permease protein
VPFAQVVASVFDMGSDQHEFVVRTLRMPRVTLALLVGAALALSGAIFQGLIRNELASPDIIGINTGASAVAFIWLITGNSVTFLPVAAFVGAVGTAGAIYLLSWKGGISLTRLVLVGIGFQAMFAAATDFFTVRYPIEQVRYATILTIGSVYGGDWGDVRLVAVGLAILAPLALLLAWPLRLLQLGDNTARSLGVPLETSRLALMVVGCWLSAIAISVAGAIGFVALMVPHAARMLCGPMSAATMVFTAVLGAGFLLACDIVAQHFLPTSLPVTVVTGVVGGPYFLFLLWRTSVRL